MVGDSGGLSKSVKKENVFLDNVKWSSKKLWKMATADVKANKKKK